MEADAGETSVTVMPERPPGLQTLEHALYSFAQSVEVLPLLRVPRYEAEDPEIEQWLLPYLIAAVEHAFALRAQVAAVRGTPVESPALGVGPHEFHWLEPQAGGFAVGGVDAIADLVTQLRSCHTGCPPDGNDGDSAHLDNGGVIALAVVAPIRQDVLDVHAGKPLFEAVEKTGQLRAVVPVGRDGVAVERYAVGCVGRQVQLVAEVPFLPVAGIRAGAGLGSPVRLGVPFGTRIVGQYLCGNSCGNRLPEWAIS